MTSKIYKTGEGCVRWLITHDPEIELNMFLEDCRIFPNSTTHYIPNKDVIEVTFKELEQDAAQESLQKKTT